MDSYTWYTHLHFYDNAFSYSIQNISSPVSYKFGQFGFYWASQICYSLFICYFLLFSFPFSLAVRSDKEGVSKRDEWVSGKQESNLATNYQLWTSNINLCARTCVIQCGGMISQYILHYALQLWFKFKLPAVSHLSHVIIFLSLLLSPLSHSVLRLGKMSQDDLSIADQHLPFPLMPTIEITKRVRLP